MGFRTRTTTRMAMLGALPPGLRGPGVALAPTLVMATVMGLAPGVGVGSALAQTVPTTQVGAADPCQRGGVLTAEDRAAIHALMVQRLQERLGFTDQRAEELRAIFQAQQEAMREAVHTLCQARVELRTLMGWLDADPTAMRAATDKVKAAHAVLVDRRLDGYLALRARLTAAEWAQWVELMGPRGY
jgi:Spy/CpxP family protein refolding chaperone